MLRTRARGGALALALLLILMAPAASALRLSTVSDTGVDTTTRTNVANAVNDGSQGALGLGDYGHDAPIDDSLAVLRPLLSKGAYLVVGNHDSKAELQSRGYLPEGATWSELLGGVRVVGADTNQRIARGSTEYGQVRDMLCGARESVKVLALHKPWWLKEGARHPASEFPGSPSDMDALVRECGVDLVLAGHEHNYQRALRNGAVYVIAPPSGAYTRAVLGSADGTVASCQCFGRIVLDLSSGSISARVVEPGGRQRDSFTVGGGSTSGGAPAITFSRSSGNEWWVQVYVGGADASRVTKVEAMDTGGTWVRLSLRSWGAWAGSFHVEPGHLVQYRATLSDGRTALSCLYTHPGGVCTSGSGGGGAFEATFRNVRGNEWWVETDVSVTGGTLAGVDARVDGGAWTALSRTSWGSWARSLHAPQGSDVEFRARASDGRTDVSASYPWPP